MRGRAKPSASLLAGPRLRWGLPGRFRLEAGHSGWATRFGLALQFGNPPLQPLNHPLLFQNGGLQLGDDGDEDIAGGGGQVNFGIHSQPAFGQFTSPSLNCYPCTIELQPLSLTPLKMRKVEINL